MHALNLAEHAALVALHSPSMLAHRLTPPRTAQQQYWLQSKYRHEFWSNRLAIHRQDIQKLGVTHRRQSWLKIIPIIEDILISEPLTRCIAYHARLLAQQLIDPDFSTLANSALASHIEARHRCLHLLVFGEGLSVEHSVRLNRIRRQLEAYTDSLLCTMDELESAASICFDAFWTQQVREQCQQHPGAAIIDVRRLHLESVRKSLRPSLAGRLMYTLPYTPNNQRISDAIAGLFPADCFDFWGVIKGPGLAALQAESSEGTLSNEFFNPPKQGTIAQLIVSKRPSTSDSSASHNPRWD